MSKEKISKGSGNVFADLGMENPEEWQGKARLAAEIMSAIEQNGWTQTEAADYLGIKQVEVSNIKRGRFDRFTMDRLMQYLMKLERDVQILVKSRSDHRKGRLAVKCT